ncbi:MAG: chromosome segregation protein SMC [Firmicutes bacterium]|nr:chromosome segregation protein SMC [Bacillota bacterium]
MFLKRVEMYGFKSFPDKVDLEFDPGVAVIVGPNGSGKSNVADAIRWVLGEQSARAVRGSRMEDVIFAGNHKRKPLSIAEVSITFDNSDGLLPLDFSEVTVTRRVLRDGESEYYVNKKACRLKDIAEWFADTGVGRDSFSVLAQGRVDEILLVKPEERRAIFEEVAGIVKFRNRKREAIRKLEETEEGLVRLGDIIQEVERQLGPLKEQEEKARRHLDLRNRLMSLQVGVYLTQIQGARMSLQATMKRIEGLKGKRAEAEEALLGLEACIEKLKAAEQQAAAAVTALKDRISACEIEGSRLDEQIKTGQERLNDVRASMESLVKESSTLDEQIKALAAEVEARSADAAAAAGALAGEAAALADAELNLGVLNRAAVKAEEDLERRKGELIEALNALSSRRNEAAEIRLRSEGLAREKARLTQERIRLAAELQRLGDESRSARERRSSAEAARAESESLLSEARERISETEARKVEMEARAQGLRDEVSSLESRIGLLEEMQASHEGYLPGPRAVLEAVKGPTPAVAGIVGAVADVIKVPREYEGAFEIALGESAQYVITRGEDDARAAIDYLNGGRFGRATFLPAGSVRPSALTPEESDAVARAGFARPAMSMVECDARYLPAVSHLLGRIVFTDTAEHALLLARRTAYRLKVVSMDGAVIGPGGSLSGGQNGAATGLLGRSGEIRLLREKLALLGVEIAGMRERLARTITERETLGRQMKILEQQIWSAGSGITEAGKEEERLVAERSRLEERARGIDAELERADEMLRQGEARLRNLDGEVAASEAEQEKIRGDISSMQDELRKAREGRDQAMESVTRMRVSVAAIEGSRNNAQESLGRATRELLDAKKRRDAQKAEIARLKSTGQGISKDSAAARQRLEELAREKEEAAGALSSAVNQREETLARIAATEKETAAKRKHLQDIINRVNEGDIQIARAEMEIDSLKGRLLSEWGVAEADYGGFDALPVEETAPVIAEARAGLDALGTVNLGAIEEYRTTKERYDFLRRQIDDMQAARESLQEIIRDVDKKMAQVFVESFEKVRENFRDVFKEMFGGGSADLSLTEGVHPLEAGVEIAAQPPGRRVHNLNLLSGGEKVMTAIALLFAILRVKPSPFCVLDEIDSSLDDANVERFGKFLKNYSGGTQFIVITHQKSTMELADRLYGITMEEPGVSKMISVRLVEKTGEISGGKAGEKAGAKAG